VSARRPCASGSGSSPPSSSAHIIRANEVDVLRRASSLCRDATDERRGTMLCEPDRTITYSLYLPKSVVAAHLPQVVRDARRLGRARFVEPESGRYREITTSSRRAARSRRRASAPPRFVLHHTTVATRWTSSCFLASSASGGQASLRPACGRGQSRVAAVLVQRRGRAPRFALDLANHFSSSFRTRPSRPQPASSRRTSPGFDEVRDAGLGEPNRLT